CVVDETLGNWSRIMPKRSARPGIQCEGIISCRHKHHSVHDHWSHFKKIGVAGMEHPLRAQLRYVALIDLRELGVTLAGIIAVIGRPVLGNRSHEQVGRGHADRTGFRLFVRRGHCQTYGQTNKAKKCRHEKSRGPARSSGSKAHRLDWPSETRSWL